jgi:hypothetical protein
VASNTSTYRDADLSPWCIATALANLKNYKLLTVFLLARDEQRL